MRNRVIFAALLASVSFALPAAAQEERHGRDRGGEGMRAAPEQVERAPRQDWQAQRQHRVEAQVQAQPQVQPQARQNWQARRAEGGNAGGGRGNWNGGGGGWQQRQTQAPVVATPQQQVPADGNRGWRGNGGGNWHNRKAVRQAPAPQANPNWQNRGDGERRWDGNRDGNREQSRSWNNNNRNWQNQNRNYGQHRNWSGNQGWNQHRGRNDGWNRDWRQDRRYDWQSYRYSNRNIYRLPRYYSPYGYNYSYERFGIGIYLDSLFYGSRYRISDPWQYRLPPAQYPYEWVRYYDDVLLVDTRDGYVVDVIYDFFD